MAKTTLFSGKMRSIRALRMSYGCLTVVLRFYTDYSNVKIQTKMRYKAPRFSEKMRPMRPYFVLTGCSMILY